MPCAIAPATSARPPASTAAVAAVPALPAAASLPWLAAAALPWPAAATSSDAPAWWWCPRPPPPPATSGGPARGSPPPPPPPRAGARVAEFRPPPLPPSRRPASRVRVGARRGGGVGRERLRRGFAPPGVGGLQPLDRRVRRRARRSVRPKLVPEARRPQAALRLIEGVRTACECLD